MKSMIIALALALPVVAGCNSSKKVEDKPVPVAATVATPPKTVEEAVADTHYRTPDNRNRDQYRHPVETLNFFGLKPEMTVVEIAPGGGWYMEILAPLLSEKGHYVAALPEKGLNEYMDKYVVKLDAYLEKYPELKPKVARANFLPPSHMELGPAGSADMVVTFRNVHSWMGSNTHQGVFNSAFKVLKPGGVLGVVEHRADPKGKKDLKGTSGYVPEKDVIRFAEKAGFKLEAKSEINANSKDTRNHPKGVWTLPPSLALGDQDREKYVAIGESDRMTLRFVKPAAKK